MIKDLFLLFKRAPLWRYSFLLSCLSGIFVIYFPPHILKNYAPWLPGKIWKNPRQQSIAQTLSLQNKNASPTTILYPSMAISFHHHIDFAHHQIPLPSGDWHPILQAETKEIFPMAFISLVRVTDNHITGLIFSEATLQNAPLSLTENMLTPCHDDRNFIVERYEHVEDAECILLQPAPLTGLEVNSDNFVNDSIARLRLSGFVLPPFMIASSWRHMQMQASPQGEQTRNYITIDTLIPPLTPHKETMFAPFEAWLYLWQPMLEKGFINALPSFYPNKNDHDPLAP